MEVASEIREVTIEDRDYPAILRELPDPPTRLYYRGDLSILQQPMISVVGTRKPTPYGVRVTNLLVADLARSFVVVSGLAYGIDALAHEATIAAGGKTAAILGSGIDDASIYPTRHSQLARKIVENGGLVMSEYPAGSEPLKFHFPARNRIIAGLADRLLVIEAGQVSGTLITAQLALDYNKEVWAVPGPITSPLSRGTNWLISQGARPVVTIEELCGEVGMIPQVSLTLENLDERERQICSLLANEPWHINDLAAKTGFDISTLSGILTLLEMKRIIKNSGNGIFVRVR